MKTTKIFILTGMLAVAVIVSFAFINFKKTTNKPSANSGFAVVELFTSEGCSSCPPADAVVAKLEKESASKPIYILAFHVDYWNSLGWRDVFSSAENSNRQKDYARYLKLSSVYTPQIVVNGKTEFVGSEEGTLRNALKIALQKEVSTQLNLANMQISRSVVMVHYDVKQSDGHSALLLALVQKSAQSHVKAGENNGRTLSHVQIVQKLQSVALGNNKTGTERINLPNDFTPQGWEVVGFIQNTVTGEITSAARAEFGLAAGKDVE
jgi:hypothetical protein